VAPRNLSLGGFEIIDETLPCPLSEPLPAIWPHWLQHPLILPDIPIPQCRFAFRGIVRFP
jgi:hypothetical protein